MMNFAFETMNFAFKMMECTARGNYFKAQYQCVQYLLRITVLVYDQKQNSDFRVSSSVIKNSFDPRKIQTSSRFLFKYSRFSS